MFRPLVRHLRAFRMSIPLRIIAFGQAALILACLSVSQAFAADAGEYRVSWNTPGKGFADSMPIGNGDIGLNLWTEENGDVVFLIGKTDAWTENGQLVKLGRVRLKLTPSPFTNGPDFRQVLSPRLGEIQVGGASGANLRVWVDASAGAIHLEMKSAQPVSVQAGVELWRTQRRRVALDTDIARRGYFELQGIPEGALFLDPDTILPARNNRLTWLHHNTRSIYPLVMQNQHLGDLMARYPDPLLNRNFGVTMKGAGLVSSDDQTLQSAKALSSFRLDLYALANQAARIEDWQADLNRAAAKIDAAGIETARKAHQQWWDAFWNRSWIKVAGNEDAAAVTQGYAIQRWMSACAGRGAMPIKFNGSIFTVGQENAEGAVYDTAKNIPDPDFRGWGSNFWFQNERHMYWPMIAAGDFDTLAPFYKMYLNALPLARDRLRQYFDHDGAIFQETIYFWGLPNNNDYGWGNPSPVMTSRWLRYHVNSGLELTAMLLDLYDTTEDREFARTVLMPLASAFTTYFDRHWKRVDGKFRFDPAAAIETRQTAVNPAPDIAGLLAVLPRLIALPPDLANEAQRSAWKKTLADLPPLPRGRTDAQGRQPQLPAQAVAGGKEILWAAESFAATQNSENPELYAVFPFRLFGVNLPELELARATFEARRFREKGCWNQSGIDAADLGLAHEAQNEVTANFKAFGRERFSWFWKTGHDWEPDMDNGGAGQTILQSMLLQSRGDRILLFPAWPREWDVDFKLHAPKNTVIEATVRNGRVEKMKVTPESRAKDVVTLPLQ